MHLIPTLKSPFTLIFMNKFIVRMGCIKGGCLFVIILNLTAMDSNIDSDTNFNYYHEYCRAYLSNIVLLSQMR